MDNVKIHGLKRFFEPNPNSYSTFLDVKKLCDFHNNYDLSNNWNRWIIVIGFEREDKNEYPLDLFFPNMFDFITNNIVQVPYVEFISVSNNIGDIHPFHQVLKLYAFKY
jgi:hypothetical protein